MSEYAWKIAAQQWRNDPYYVASSAPVHKVTVVADSKKAALAEAERLLDEPSAGRYWRFWVGKATDVRLVKEMS